MIGRSVFYTKILPYIIYKNRQGYRSINIIEQEGCLIKGLVVPEIKYEFPRVVIESKENGFNTTVKIWEEGHISPPYYNIHIEW
jgi:hypothetical protein